MPSSSSTSGNNKETNVKYKPVWAYVYFEVDGQRDFVPISGIKNFYPRSQLDFDPNVTVEALFRPKNGEQMEPTYFNARILKLGLSEDLLRKDIDLKRVPVPKILIEDRSELIDNPSTSRKSGDGGTKKEKADSNSAHRKHKKEKSHTQHRVSAAALAAAKLKAKARRRKLSSSSSDDEILVKKSLLNDLDSQVKKLDKRVKVLEDKEKLRQEAETQSEEERVVYKSNKLIKQPFQRKKDVIDEERELIPGRSSGELYDENEVHDDDVEEKPAVNDDDISGDITEETSSTEDSPNIPTVIKDYKVPSLSKLQESKLNGLVANNSAWLKALASFMFPPQILQQCTYEGKGSNRNKVTCFPLPLSGKQKMLEMYERKLKTGGCSDASVLGSIEKVVKAALNEKCSAARRPPKSVKTKTDE